MKLVLQILGGFLVFSGLFWSLQGAGIIMWPAESFMLAQDQWILYGLITAAVGGVLIWPTLRAALRASWGCARASGGSRSRCRARATSCLLPANGGVLIWLARRKG